MAYSEKVIDHYENPRNVGKMEEDNTVGTGMVGAPACGDVMRLQIRVNQDGIIEDAKFKIWMWISDCFEFSVNRTSERHATGRC